MEPRRGLRPSDLDVEAVGRETFLSGSFGVVSEDGPAGPPPAA
jgi:hypothetical protein